MEKREAKSSLSKSLKSFKKPEARMGAEAK